MYRTGQAHHFAVKYVEMMVKLSRMLEKKRHKHNWQNNLYEMNSKEEEEAKTDAHALTL